MSKHPLLAAIILSCLLFHFSVVMAETDSTSNECYSLHAQTTVIMQYKPSFQVPYSGINSLQPGAENRTSVTSTLYAGVRGWKGASFFINPELAGGSGLSEALGIASASNGETFRIGNPAPKIYLARLFYRQVIALSSATNQLPADQNQLGGKEATHYVAFTIGKVAIADYFDQNTYSHDPRTQFMAWGLMSNGAWDYPANTRGYTPSMIIEYTQPAWSLRYGLSLMPTTPNGSTMSWKIGQSNSQTIEWTHRHLIQKRKGAIRVLLFYTLAPMGDYSKSLALQASQPDLSVTRKTGNNKFGIAFNAEQETGTYSGCFARAGWNDGRHETWAFTEIDRSMQAGYVWKGHPWGRANDHAGVALVCSGLSKDHRRFLAAGGHGFMLGDGHLNYAPEWVTEFSYAAALIPDNLILSGVYQLAVNPGYNRDRQGPVNIFSVRLHSSL